MSISRSDNSVSVTVTSGSDTRIKRKIVGLLHNGNSDNSLYNRPFILKWHTLGVMSEKKRMI